MIVFAIVVLYPPILASTLRANANVPLVKVKVTLSDALAILHNQNVPIEQRRRALLQLAHRNLDLAEMARESLGEHWNELTPAERNEFVPLFEAFIADAYLAKIQDYAGMDIQANHSRFLAPDYAEVDATARQPDQGEVGIAFMLERHDKDWIVYDVKIEGVSMIQNYRTQFDRIIAREGKAGLLADLRAKQQHLAALIGEH